MTEQFIKKNNEVQNNNNNDLESSFLDSRWTTCGAGATGGLLGSTGTHLAMGGSFDSTLAIKGAAGAALGAAAGAAVHSLLDGRIGRLATSGAAGAALGVGTSLAVDYFMGDE